jgi:hypothetical protein
MVFVLIVFQSDYVLEPCLKSVLPFGKVVAAEGPVRFWQERGFTTSTDRTNDILERYHVPTIRGQWSEKDEECNAAISLVPDDTDYVWCLDADEIWKADTILQTLGLLDSLKLDSVSFKATSFYGGFDRYMTGFEEDFEVHRIQRFYPGAKFYTHRPPTILAPDGRPWRAHRHLNHETTDEMGLRFHHYSYVFPSQMRMKAEYYAGMRGTIEGYFDTVYRPWILGDDADRLAIETAHNGVHNWLPERRGPCWTEPFVGEHPAEIQAAMPMLLDRFNEELTRL